ncbi:L-lactate dehydrogenase (cytochrome) [Trichoderma gamsii]|uniref:L-lactate dehydrogenase (Cytochrome) n=1 Tax=Trichoderma gamsii TaxID=398673 RepID=A0A2P4ZBS9_9HYPO|nr:L-lactate dehydrogenase (cytochrome) [Trichoderma gamsii]PON21737.1 L-lactate dehydrogenase (cytochrome) [Trichoderma gamsii]
MATNNTAITQADLEAPLAYEAEVYRKGLKFERPPFTFQTTDWEPQAKEVLSASAWGYVYGSAGQRETHNKNLAAFKKWGIIPNRLVDANYPDLSTTLFGEKFQSPIAIAPVGVQKIFNPEGEIATATAASKEGVLYIMSSASSTSIEDVAKANGEGPRWYQLYWPSNEDNDITISILERAKKAGFTVLVVTLDTYMLGWRPSDMNNGYNPFLRPDSIGVEIGFTDPVFQRKFKLKHGKDIKEDLGTAAAEWARTIFPGRSHGWDNLKFLRENWSGPIVLKGIQTITDAQRAVAAGMDGIVVSNHGGRQQDGGPSSLEQLPKIARAVGDKISILFDSGVRCGADIAKALALGASMVLVGRPYVYGLSLGGEEGVRHVLKSLAGELSCTLHLAGIPGAGRDILNEDCLVREV